jgi:hypothetical protein
MVIESLRFLAGAFTIFIFFTLRTLTGSRALTLALATFTGLAGFSLFSLFLSSLLKRFIVPLSRLANWELFEWCLTRHQTTRGKFSLEMTVDREVSSEIPHLALSGKVTPYLIRHTTRDVLEEQMVELVLEDPANVFVGKPFEELRAVKHFKASGVRIDTHTRSRNGTNLLIYIA